MIDYANPINWDSDLNQSLVFWAMALPGMDRPGFFPEIVRRRNGTLVNHQQTNSLGWGPSTFPNQAGFYEYRLNQSNMYVSFPSPPETQNAGSFSASCMFNGFSEGGTTGSAAWFTGRRTQTTSAFPAFAFTQQGIFSGSGLCAQICQADGTNQATSHGGVNQSGRGPSIFTLAYDATSRIVTSFLYDPYGIDPNIQGNVHVSTATLASPRDPDSGLLLGCWEASGAPSNFVFNVCNARMWNRCLSLSQMHRIAIDAMFGYQDTLRRPSRKKYFVQPGMTFTGRLGTSDSQLGNIVLTGGGLAVSSSVYNRDVSEALTLTQAAVKSVTVHRDVNQSLVLAELAEVETAVLHIHETLTLTEAAVHFVPRTHVRNIVNVLTFYQQLDKLVVKIKNVSETLILAEEAAIRTPRVYDLTINESLVINQNLPKRRTTVRPASNLLVLVESVAGGHSKNTQTYESIDLVEHASGVNGKLGFAHDSFALSETLTHKKIRINSIHETLVIAESMIKTGSVFHRDINEHLPLKGGMQLPIRLAGLKVSISEAEYVKVPKRCSVTLECMKTSTVIVLPCPEMGDTQKSLHSQVIKRSMNNLLYTYIRKNKLEELKYTFVLGLAVAQNLETFCDVNIGNVITLTNWKGEIWKVNITTNPIDFIAKSLFENEGERWEVTLEFQGAKILG